METCEWCDEKFGNRLEAEIHAKAVGHPAEFRPGYFLITLPYRHLCDSTGKATEHFADVISQLRERFGEIQIIPNTFRLSGESSPWNKVCGEIVVSSYLAWITKRARKKPAPPQELPMVELDLVSVSALNITTRTQNILRKAGIKTASDLSHYNAESLLQLKNFGRWALTEVYEAMKHVGFEIEGAKEIVGE